MRLVRCVSIVLLACVLPSCARIEGTWSETHFVLVGDFQTITETGLYQQSGLFYSRSDDVRGLIAGPFFAGLTLPGPFVCHSNTQLGGISGDRMAGLAASASWFCLDSLASEAGSPRRPTSAPDEAIIVPCGSFLCLSVFVGSRANPIISGGKLFERALRWRRGTTALEPSWTPSARQTANQPVMAWTPSSATYVVYVDLAAVMATPIGAGARPNPDASGIDPHDVDSFAYYLQPTRRGQPPQWGIAMTGELEPARILSSMASLYDVSARRLGEDTVYAFSPGTDIPSLAFAFPNAATVLFGTPEQVPVMLDAGSGRAPSVDEGPLSKWLDDTATFLIAGSMERGTLRQPDGLGDRPLRQVSLSGWLSRDDLRIVARGEAPGARTALTMADSVRSYLSYTNLRHQKPGRRAEALGNLDVHSSGREVEASFSITHETLTALR